jgi:hypothetical protein
LLAIQDMATIKTHTDIQTQASAADSNWMSRDFKTSIWNLMAEVF